MDTVISLLRVTVRALLRLEKKLDEALILLSKQLLVPLQGLNYTHQVCPLCHKTVEYYLVKVDNHSPKNRPAVWVHDTTEPVQGSGRKE